MAYISSQSTRTVGAVIQYVRGAKNDRCVHEFGIGGVLPGAAERQFRATRERHGKDVYVQQSVRDENGHPQPRLDKNGDPIFGSKFVQGYALVISLDKDELDPDEPESWAKVEALVRTLVSDQFPDGTEGYVGLQNNGRGHKLHAHVVLDAVNPKTGRSLDSSLVQHKNLAFALSKALAENGMEQREDMARIEAEVTESGGTFNDAAKRLYLKEQAHLRHVQWGAQAAAAEAAGEPLPVEPFSLAVLEERITETLADPRFRSWDELVEVGAEHGVRITRRSENSDRISFGMIRRQADGSLGAPAKSDTRTSASLGAGFTLADIEAAIERNVADAEAAKDTEKQDETTGVENMGTTTTTTETDKPAFAVNADGDAEKIQELTEDQRELLALVLRRTRPGSRKLDLDHLNARLGLVMTREEFKELEQRWINLGCPPLPSEETEEELEAELTTGSVEDELKKLSDPRAGMLDVTKGEEPKRRAVPNPTKVDHRAHDRRVRQLVNSLSNGRNEEPLAVVARLFLVWIQIQRVEQQRQAEQQQYEREVAAKQQHEREGGDPERFRGISAETGKEEVFRRKVGDHLLTNAECARGLRREEIEFDYQARDGKTLRKVGRLAPQEWEDKKGNKHPGFGFEQTDAYDPQTHVRGVWSETGKPAKIKKQHAGHDFTEAELDAMFAGETVRFRGQTKDGRPKVVTGKIGVNQWTKDGTEHESIGFVEDPERTFIATWGGHDFSEREIDLLLNGNSIMFDAVSKRTGKHYVAAGGLGVNEWPDPEKPGKKRTSFAFQLDTEVDPMKLAETARNEAPSELEERLQRFGDVVDIEATVADLRTVIAEKERQHRDGEITDGQFAEWSMRGLGEKIDWLVEEDAPRVQRERQMGG